MMTGVKTTDYVIGVVYSLLSSIDKPKYLTTAPDFEALNKTRPTEYVVINSLPIPAGVIQKCHVNVNYHVKDIPGGIKDDTALESGSVAIIAALKEVSAPASGAMDAYMIDFEGQETIREESHQEHYSNLRFSFKNINN